MLAADEHRFTLIKKQELSAFLNVNLRPVMVFSRLLTVTAAG